MLKILILCLISVNCLALSGYQVELIVFSHVTAKNVQSEQWPIETNTLANASSNKSSPEDYTLVEAKDFTLKNEQHRLNKYSSYKTLVHVAWRESLAQIANTTTVHIYGGKLYDDQGNIISTSTNMSYPYDLNQQWQVNGTVTVNLNRYFNVNLNLLYAIPWAKYIALNPDANQTTAQNFKYFRLMQTRRTRSKEINYIDHPIVAAIFKITPIQ